MYVVFEKMKKLRTKNLGWVFNFENCVHYLYPLYSRVKISIEVQKRKNVPKSRIKTAIIVR